MILSLKPATNRITHDTTKLLISQAAMVTSVRPWMKGLNLTFAQLESMVGRCRSTLSNLF